ncbi:YczE/YyaS/YitT family protein [Atopobacter phocae]|uniref:YczE/YyaS/YitT family protein n=1 Tax=Atopobacter phocae TaxID=136492 RepID=UPI000470481F|nr:hypothetical protein [Atopobacter phocae]
MKITKRLIINAIGSLIMGFGISLLLAISRGTDTITLFFLGIQQHIAVELWLLALLFNIAIVCIVYFIDASKMGIGTFVNFLIVSLSFKIFPPVVMSWHFLNTDSLLLSIGFVLMAITTFSLGTGLYAASSLGSAALEALSIALAEKTKWSIQVYRMIFDASLVLMAIVLGVLPQYATLLSVLLVGPISQRIFLKVREVI